MKSFLLVAMSLVGASAQVTPTTMRTCSENSDCAEYGDTGATCTTGTGLCQCGAGYSAFTATPSTRLVSATLSVCLPAGNPNNQEADVEVVFSMNFPNANCQAINLIRPDFLAATKKALTGTTAEIKVQSHSCYWTTYTPVPETDAPATAVPVAIPSTDAPPPTPVPPPTPTPPTAVPTPSPTFPNVVASGTGVYVSTVVELKVKDLYTDQVVNFEAKVRAQLNSQSTLHYGTSSSFLVHTVKGTNLLCPNIGVATTAMAYFGIDASSRAQCRPAECLKDWRVTEEGLCRDSTNRPYPINPAEDDDLSTGHIAAIVASIAAFLVIVIIIVYCVCLREEPAKNDKNNPDEDDSSSSSSKGKEEE